MSAEDDTREEKANWHWRNTMRPAQFFNLDARAALPFLVLLVYFRWSSFIITIVTVMVFKYLEKKGLTFPAALRALRVWFIGNNRYGLLSYRRRQNIDYG